MVKEFTEGTEGGLLAGLLPASDLPSKEQPAMSAVLITGASKGIGRVTATELTRRGHRVIATARDPRTLDDLKVDQRLRLDVTEQASIDAAVAEAGEIDVLLSNAGVMSTGAVEATPIDEIERLIA